MGLKRLRRTIVLRKVKEWEILFPQLKDNTLHTSGGVNMLFQIKNSCPQVFYLGGWFSFYELKLIEIKRKGYYGYNKGILRKDSKEMKYAYE